MTSTLYLNIKGNDNSYKSHHKQLLKMEGKKILFTKIRNKTKFACLLL